VNNTTEIFKPSGRFGVFCRTIADRWKSLSEDERSKYTELAATDRASYKIRMSDYRELQYQNSLLNRGPAKEESPVLSYQHSDHSQQPAPTLQQPQVHIQSPYNSQEVTSLPRHIQLALLLQAQVSESSQPRDVHHQQGQSQQIVLSSFQRERLEREAVLNLRARPSTSGMPPLAAFLPQQQQQQQQQDESALTRFLRRPGEGQRDMTSMQQQQQPSQQLDVSSLLPMLLLQQNRRRQQQQQVQHQGTNMFEGNGRLQQQLNALTIQQQQQQQQRFGFLGDATRNSTVFTYLPPPPEPPESATK
jgi:hypothetical protein